MDVILSRAYNYCYSYPSHPIQVITPISEIFHNYYYYNSDIKAFTSWINGLLSSRGVEIKDIIEDFSDGIAFMQFVELLSDKKPNFKHSERPPNGEVSRIQKIENVYLALNFLEKDLHFPLQGVGPQGKAIIL